jgi:endonuclease/exonuclease/phosphatase family metal-dependent hydrolase
MVNDQLISSNWKVIKHFKILNWNIAGAKYLEGLDTWKENHPNKKVKEKFREETKQNLNNALKTLIDAKDPDVVTLQEAVQWDEDSKRFLNDPTQVKEIIDREQFPDYDYYFFPLIETCRLSAKDKWDKVKVKGGWNNNPYFGQGNGFLIKKQLKLYPVLDLYEPDSIITNDITEKRDFIEQINFESGLYMGNRDTERRSALIAHFILDSGEKQEKVPNENSNPGRPKPIDIFVVNTHLTTLTREREGIPKIDVEATEFYRIIQLKMIFQGIISRYNEWRRLGYPNRGEIRKFAENETKTTARFEPIWIVAGDFNFMPDSNEYQYVQTMNFIDIIPGKGAGSKAPGFGKPATITLDYIFAGPKYISLDPVFTKLDIRSNFVYDVHEMQIQDVSDHYPMFASIPIRIKSTEEFGKCDKCGKRVLIEREEIKNDLKPKKKEQSHNANPIK